MDIHLGKKQLHIWVTKTNPRLWAWVYSDPFGPWLYIIVIGPYRISWWFGNERPF